MGRSEQLRTQGDALAIKIGSITSQLQALQEGATQAQQDSETRSASIQEVFERADAKVKELEDSVKGIEALQASIYGIHPHNLTRMSQMLEHSTAESKAELAQTRRALRHSGHRIAVRLG